MYVLPEGSDETVNIDDQARDEVGRGQLVTGIRTRPVRIETVEHWRVL